MKKILAIVICILALSAAVECLADDERTSGLFTYQIKGNGTLTITKFDWGNNSGDVYIPSMIDGYTVTAIGDEAFAGEDRLYLGDSGVVVVLPNTIVSIGEKAFFQAPISSIDIPLSVKYIGNGAFAGALLEKIGVAPGHEAFASIDGALYNKTEKALIAYPAKKNAEKPIPNGIVKIAPYACYYCRHISQLHLSEPFLPDTVKEIGDYAFYDINLDARTFPAISVDVIGEYAFADAFVEDDRDHNLYNIVIDSRVIGDYAFFDAWDSNASFTLGNHVETIGKYAFSYSNKIDDKYNKMKIVIDPESSIKEIREGAFSEALICNPTEGMVAKNESQIVIIPESCEYIGSDAFNGVQYVVTLNSDRIYRLVVSGQVKKIPSGAFKNAKIDFIEIPGSVENIGEAAFENNANLKSINIGEGSVLREIGNNAFSGCKRLDAIVLPDTIQKIGENAFVGCEKLSEIRLPAGLSEIGNACFDRQTITLIVDAGSYAELWASENGYSYRHGGESSDDDLSWLND